MTDNTRPIPASHENGQADNTQELDKILEQAYLDGASETMWQNDRHVEIFATAKKELLGIIRTEKLKLLEDVRERVVGEKIAPHFDNEYGYCDNCEFQPTDGTRHCLCYYDEKLRKKQRAALTKLEAEL